MKPEKINRLIAEAVGYTDLYVTAPDRGSLTERVWGKINGLNRQVPNYHNDLNAMHEAIMTLTVSQGVDYLHHLNQITYKQFVREKDKPEPLHPHTFSTVNATAAQKAEAFCKTLGIWEEEE